MSIKLLSFIAALVCFVLAVVFSIINQGKAYQVCIALGLSFLTLALGPIG